MSTMTTLMQVQLSAAGVRAYITARLHNTPIANPMPRLMRMPNLVQQKPLETLVETALVLMHRTLTELAPGTPERCGLCQTTTRIQTHGMPHSPTHHHNRQGQRHSQTMHWAHASSRKLPEYDTRTHAYTLTLQQHTNPCIVPIYLHLL